MSPIYRQPIITIINGSLIRTVSLNDRTTIEVQWKADAWSVVSRSVEAGLYISRSAGLALKDINVDLTFKDLIKSL